ncbi:MAG: helix-turn-helix domain-containing protein [Hyphomicrobiaceae bacterium]
MPKGYSKDLRERAFAMVEDGKSRREVARVLDLAPSTAVRWLERWSTAGTVDAKPGTGHSRSPLKACEQWLLDLALLRSPRDHIQKKSCTRPSRIGLTLPPRDRS